LAENGDKLHKPSRESAKREIHRLITEEGLSNNQLCERLNIPKRTLERYLHGIYQEDSQVLINPTKELIAQQMSIFNDRLSRHYQIAMAIATDSSVEGNSRVNALHLATDLAYCQAQLPAKFPMILQRQMSVNLVRKIQKLPLELPSNNNNNLPSVKILEE